MFNVNMKKRNLFYQPAFQLENLMYHWALKTFSLYRALKGSKTFSYSQMWMSRMRCVYFAITKPSPGVRCLVFKCKTINFNLQFCLKTHWKFIMFPVTGFCIMFLKWINPFGEIISRNTWCRVKVFTMTKHRSNYVNYRETEASGCWTMFLAGALLSC